MIRVLIVDDDRLVRKGLISAMPWQEFGMEVIGETSNGAKALEFMEAQSIDLLVTDLSMPVMSGMELMDEIRKRYPKVLIVVLTVSQDFESIQEALRLGAIDYIAKFQLEQERFDEVLRRITARINEIDAARREEHGGFLRSSASDEPIEEQWREIRKQLATYEWIPNEPLFHMLLNELAALNLSHTQLIPLLAELVFEWNRVFGAVLPTQINLPKPDSQWEAICKWFMDTRQVIYEAIHKRHFSPEVTNAVLRALDIIQGNLETQITAADVAVQISMSRSYFCQCFKDIVGATFNDYLRNARIEKAKEYLIGTNRTIQWIAEHTGYMDERYFSRIFREQTGSLPSEFRKSFRVLKETLMEREESGEI